MVNKGTLRNNPVTIKRPNESNDTEYQMEEFNNEVGMLDKLRSVFIVHFYGAVFIPNKMCIVTKFDEYGSFNDLRMSRIDKPIDEPVGIEILLDAARGIK